MSACYASVVFFPASASDLEVEGFDYQETQLLSKFI